jgi:hypothetical protein
MNTAKVACTMIFSIIVKREPKRNGGGLIFFFPESLERGKIEYYTYAENFHGECPMAYYKECKHEYSQGEDITIPLSRYAAYIRTLPDMEDYSYKRIYKLVRK